MELATSDHTPIHNKMFDEYGVKTMLEFGLGGATRPFLDRLEKVTSVEIMTKDRALADQLKISNEDWWQLCEKEFAEYKNWELVKYYCKKPIIDAEKQVTGITAERGSNPTTTAYKEELANLIDTLSIEDYDYVFVDAGIHLRGDIVNLLFGKAKIIGAHDTYDAAIYGYNRVVTPPDYRKVEAMGDVGTTFWIWEK